MTMIDADEDLLEEMVSYRQNVTGVAHTVFISPRGRTRHAPRIKVAIDPPDSINPDGYVAVVEITSRRVLSGALRVPLRKQVERFLILNREVLLDYWDYRIDTDQLRKRLTSISRGAAR